jgi:predicted ATPase
MMMIIGLTGAQGAGKSTLLEELKARGWAVDPYKVSRAVQNELGWSNLHQVMESWDTMRKFQDLVRTRKTENDEALKGPILVERTFADIVAYTQYWTWELVDARKISLGPAMAWLREYTLMCLEAQNRIYSSVLLLPLMEHVQFVDDPHRARRNSAEQVYQNEVNFVLMSSTPYFEISAKTTAERADQVINFLNRN